jgi:hypothetical protein
MFGLQRQPLAPYPVVCFWYLAVRFYQALLLRGYAWDTMDNNAVPWVAWWLQEVREAFRGLVKVAEMDSERQESGEKLLEAACDDWQRGATDRCGPDESWARATNQLRQYQKWLRAVQLAESPYPPRWLIRAARQLVWSFSFADKKDLIRWLSPCPREAATPGLLIQAQSKESLISGPSGQFMASPSWPSPFQGWITLEAVLQKLRDEAVLAAAHAVVTSKGTATGAFPVLADAHLLTGAPGVLLGLPERVEDGKVTGPCSAGGAVMEDIAEPCHGKDFRSVNWFGEEYSFTPCQARVVKVLWEAWERGGLAVSYNDLQLAATVDSERMTDLFRRHPALNTMIVRVRKGVYGLKTPAGYRRGTNRPGPTPSAA